MEASLGRVKPAKYHGTRVRRDVFPVLPSRVGDVLDVGGGMGATARAMKETFAATKAGVVDMVVPDDPKAAGLDFAVKADLEDAASVAAVGAQHGPFDTILCLDVLEHLVDPWKTVRLLHATLRPGGVMVASLPNVRHTDVVVPLVLFGKWDYRESGILDETHLRFFVRGTAIELMTSSGLKLEEIRGTRLKLGRVLLNVITLGALRGFLVRQYLIRVRSA